MSKRTLLTLVLRACWTTHGGAVLSDRQHTSFAPAILDLDNEQKHT